MTDDLQIEREIILQESADEVWPLLSSADGWQQWLVDAATIDVADGAEGDVIDGGVVRHVQVVEVDEARRVTFRWWERDDPDSVSEVCIQVLPLLDGGSRMLVVERPLVASASASASALQAAWDMRALLLALSLAACALVRA
ncbi:MAG: SRPBCC family protein [Actinomycetota bacterium]|nr:SRPBCC family protein [Actinomycetota bacterium]